MRPNSFRLIACRTSHCLFKLRDTLLTYCHDSRLDIDHLCNRVWEDAFEDPSGLNIDFSRFELVDPNVDFKRSLEKLVREHVRDDLNVIFNSSRFGYTSLR